jgi:hypothetical protein
VVGGWWLVDTKTIIAATAIIRIETPGVRATTDHQLPTTNY